MPRSVWPQWEGGPTLEEYARQQFDWTPFDGRLVPEVGHVLPAGEEGDWAHQAARAIIGELRGRAGDVGHAFHPEQVDEETRVEIIDVMAAIIRESLCRSSTEK